MRKARDKYHKIFFGASGARSDIIWKKLNAVLHHNESSGNVQKTVHSGKGFADSALAEEFKNFFMNLEATEYENNGDKCFHDRHFNSTFLDPVTAARCSARAPLGPACRVTLLRRDGASSPSGRSGAQERRRNEDDAGVLTGSLLQG